MRGWEERLYIHVFVCVGPSSAPYVICTPILKEKLPSFGIKVGIIRRMAVLALLSTYRKLNTCFLIV